MYRWRPSLPQALEMGHHGRNYERLGVDHYCDGASFGLPHDVAMRSLTLFGREVMPHFRPASTPAR